MKYTDLFGLDELRQKVLQVAKIEIMSTRLCKKLSVLISEKTGRYISETTLKRLYSFAERNFQPSNYTLDTLALYCIQANWLNWQRRMNESLSAKSSNYLESLDFNKLFYLSAQPMWIFNPVDLRFLDVNNAAIQHYGYSQDEFLRMTILDIRPRGDRELIQNVVCNTSDQCHHALTFKHLLANGQIINVDIVTYALTFPEGVVRLVIPSRNG